MEKILIVVDMQNDFIDCALGTPEAKMVYFNVKKMLEEIPDNVRVIFTQDTHDTSYLRSFEGKKLPVEHCIKDTEGWCIPKELTAPFCYSPYCIEKPTFGSIELMNILKEWVNDIDDEYEFEFCGLCTDICVVSNVLLTKAFFPDVKISVRADCCAGSTPEKHAAALEVMKSCHIEVI